MIVSFSAAGIEVLASIGLGAGLLAALDLWRDRPQLERSALAFALGLGLLGWVFFWLGAIGKFIPMVGWGVCGLSTLGLLFYRIPGAPEDNGEGFARIDWVLIVLISGAFAADFLEAIAPPVDADSLAYHFELARRFAERGEIFFVPRALDGAVPMLIQMTYAVAYSMAGEKALTLWALLSGWGGAILLFALCRRWFDLTWSLALALLFQTLPAMVYGAGSGQVEARLALFVLVAVYGLIEMRRRGGWAPAVLVGLGAGFYAGSKYTGLLFLAAAGLTLLTIAGRKWFIRGAVCGLAAAIVGGQWYAWNFIHTGDPVFPVLFNTLGLPDGVYWDSSYAADMKTYLSIRYDQITWWQRWLAYPVLVTFFPPPAVEAGRVGLGPFFALIAPMALLGFWRYRHRVWQSPLGPVALTVLIFYVLWLKFGGIPKVRHLVPIVPPLLICLGAAALRCDRPWVQRPIALAMALALVVNFAAIAFFVRPFAHYAFSSMDRDTFLRRSVNDYEAVEWLNRRADVTEVLTLQRQYLYYVEAPAYFAYPGVQKVVEVRDGHVDPAKFLAQLKRHGFSHILGQARPAAKVAPGSALAAIFDLEQAGCLEEAARFSTVWHVSRTLPQFGTNFRDTRTWKVTPDNCIPDKIPGRGDRP